MAASLRNTFIAALLSAAAFAAAAQDRTQLPIQVEAKSSDFDYQNGVLKFDAITITQGEIRITADRAVASGLDFEDSRWEFSGSVRITMPEFTLASDTARVRFVDGEIQSATVTGAPATFEQQREEEHAQGRANRIDYDLGRGAVELAGDAWLFDGRTEITGATLVYRTANQRVISQEPVVITIQPEEKPPATPKPPL
ncbi:MAG: LptA/OstA family protein [Steroidobacteraceae bacterium]